MKVQEQVILPDPRTDVQQSTEGVSSPEKDQRDTFDLLRSCINMQHLHEAIDIDCIRPG